MNEQNIVGEGPTKFFIHATNIHQGGGRVLLEALLMALPCSMNIYVLLDRRMPLLKDLSEAISVKRFAPTITGRFQSELWLADNVGPDDFVLCFGNLPPLFKLHGHTVVFLHNRYLVDLVSLNSFPLKSKIRLTIERMWLAIRMQNADAIVVQTPTMKTKLENISQGKVPTRVIPFMLQSGTYKRKIERGLERNGYCDQFIYVASGEPHKNHHCLIDAWCLLAEQGIFPSLKLTLDDTIFAELCSLIREKSDQNGLKIENLGHLNHDKILESYKHVNALVFPSTLESFGIPLIEARRAGLNILASELDFVRDVVDPEETFDPSSPTSIARAIKRYMGVDETYLQLLDAEEFFQEIMESTK